MAKPDVFCSQSTMYTTQIKSLIFLLKNSLGDALITFKLNTTSSGKLYFYLDEKWPQVEQSSQCQNKLDMAQYSCKL